MCDVTSWSLADAGYQFNGSAADTFASAVCIDLSTQRRPLQPVIICIYSLCATSRGHYVYSGRHMRVWCRHDSRVQVNRAAVQEWTGDWSHTNTAVTQCIQMVNYVGRHTARLTQRKVAQTRTIALSPHTTVLPRIYLSISRSAYGYKQRGKGHTRPYTLLVHCLGAVTPSHMATASTLTTSM